MAPDKVIEQLAQALSAKLLHGPSLMLQQSDTSDPHALVEQLLPEKILTRKS